MLSLIVAAALAPLAARAVPCVQFDTANNLYAFGGSQDVQLGQSSSWARECTVSGPPNLLITQNRPSRL